MKVFRLEKYLAQHEFTAKYLLCCSDAESFSMSEILGMANEEERDLWDGLRLSYTEVPGLPALRARVAESMYNGLGPENIFMFAGAGEGIFCALKQLAGPMEHIIVITPCYQSLLEVPQSTGAEITEVELRPENEWRIDLNQIEAAIRPNTKCIVVNFPHNPTGQIIEEEELKALIALCEPRGIWLFSDEVYRMLGDRSMTSPVANLYSRGLSLGVMSKSFGLAGLRVGWVASQDREILKKMEQLKHYTSICNSAPSEILSLIALRNKDVLLERNNSIVADNLALLDGFFAEHSELFEWVRPRGGCVGFVKYKAGPAQAFCDYVLREKNLLLLPESVYNYHGNYFRIGFGRSNMPEALEQLRDFCAGNAGIR